MKDEIKEILEDGIQETIDSIKLILDNTHKCMVLLSRQNIHKVLDYITNLQTIEQQYSAILSENAELENKINNLQEKYDKALTDLVHESHKRIELQQELLNKKLNVKDIEYKEKMIYKSRNEKTIENIDIVIELIKQQPTKDDTWILNRLNGFKYLLQGEDKDV